MTKHRQKFIEALLDHMDAGCSGLYVDTTEIEHVIADAEQAVKVHGGALWRWTLTRGLIPANLVARASESAVSMDERIEFATCLRAFPAIQARCEALEKERRQAEQKQLGRPTDDADVSIPHVLVVENFNWQTNEPFAVQTLIDAVRTCRQSFATILLIGTNIKIPEQLQSLLHKIDRDLPDTDAIEEIARRVLQGDKSSKSVAKSDEQMFDELIPQDTRQAVFRAARGMTETEIEDAFSLSFTCSDGEITPKMIGDYKKKFLEKSSALEIFSTADGFDTLGGLDSLKTFLLDSLTRRANKELFPLGVMLAGPPGTAKTEVARRLGTEVKCPVVLLSVGKLLDKYVGGSEAQTANALKTVEAMSPCILVVDEMEKALAGSTGRGTSSDGGTMSRTLGTLLTWLTCKTHEVYVVATCNDLSSLPPELTRAGRFDATFFLDLPTKEQRDVIWEIYRKKYNIPNTYATPDDTEWTGAEISQCCRMSSLQGKSLEDVSDYIVPVNRSSRSQIDKVREAAHHTLIDANFKGLYDKLRYTGTKRTPSVTTDSVDNPKVTRVVRPRRSNS